MKPLFTCLLLAAGINAGAQTYIPFPTANATWTQRIGHGEAAPTFSLIGMKTGDTLLAGLTYHKVYTSTDLSLDESDFTGGLRESAKRIYYYDAAAHVERLLYDFTVAVGDTINDPSNGTAVGIVDHIDSVMISGAYHKRFNFHMLTSSSTLVGGTWIEGIGNSSLGGLLGNPIMQPTCDCAINTACAQKSSDYDYHNPQYSALDCEGVLLRTVICYGDPRSVSVYPNPVRGESVIELGGNVNYNKVNVYDMQGKCVQTIVVNAENRVPLNRVDYAPGLYLYRVQNGEGDAVNGRFVVE